MRSFMCMMIVLTACGGVRAPGKPLLAASTEDPALLEACFPEWSEAPPARCDRDDATGAWILPDDDPDRSVIAQVLALEARSQGSRSMDEAIVELLTRALAKGPPVGCGLQVMRWHRALALHRLRRWKEAFIDFGSVVKDGPNGPFYGDVGAWLRALEPYIPHHASITCLSAYDTASTDPKTAPE